jgi:hypothetical protein
MSYFIAFCSKNSLFVPNLALIAREDSHHSQGGMKFATQISPLLIYIFITIKQNMSFFVAPYVYRLVLQIKQEFAAKINGFTLY